MSNINGKVYALNVIAPMKTWKTGILRTAFFVLEHVKPLRNDLINLSKDISAYRVTAHLAIPPSSAATSPTSSNSVAGITFSCPALPPLA
jgi:hypothetical protein